MLKSAFVAAISTLAVSVASAAVVTADYGSYTVEYNDSTSFGDINSSFTAGGNSVGFSWTVPNSASLLSSGSTESQTFALPSFTLTSNPGYSLGGPVKVFLGNLTFTEVAGADTSIKVTGKVSVDGSAPVTLSSFFDRFTNPISNSSVSTGYFALDEDYDPGLFTSLKVTDASITLSASGGTFASLVSQPQNKLEISFTTPPVPEPGTTAMLLAGLGTVGWIARRRRNA